MVSPARQQDGDRTPGGARMSLALTMVPAALQGVLYLKLQLPSQLAQVDLPLAQPARSGFTGAAVAR